MLFLSLWILCPLLKIWGRPGSSADSGPLGGGLGAPLTQDCAEAGDGQTVVVRMCESSCPSGAICRAGCFGTKCSRDSGFPAPTELQAEVAEDPHSCNVWVTNRDLVSQFARNTSDVCLSLISGQLPNSTQSISTVEYYSALIKINVTLSFVATWVKPEDLCQVKLTRHRIKIHMLSSSRN